MPDELDAIVNGALKSYGDATPLAGLEQRVLNRIGSAQTGRRKLRFWHAAVAAGTIACLAAVMIGHRKVDVPARPALRTPVVVAHRIDAPVPSQPKKRPRKVRPFPSVTPLTGEERALLALTQHQPPAALQFSEPGEIEPIRIQPLQIEEQQ